jgi:hypothetical protein
VLEAHSLLCSTKSRFSISKVLAMALRSSFPVSCSSTPVSEYYYRYFRLSVLVLLTEHTTGDLSSSGSAPVLSLRSGISQFAFPRCHQIQALLSALVVSAVTSFSCSQPSRGDFCCAIQSVDLRPANSFPLVFSPYRGIIFTVTLFCARSDRPEPSVTVASQGPSSFNCVLAFWL